MVTLKPHLFPDDRNATDCSPAVGVGAFADPRTRRMTAPRRLGLSGMKSTVRRVLKAVLGPLKRKCEMEFFWVRRRIVLAMDLQPGIRRLSPKADVHFRWGSPDDLESLDLDNHAYAEPARASGRQRFAAGDRFTLGILDGKVVFYAWLMYGQMDLDFERLTPATPDEAYSYKVFTSPKYRGLGICPAYYSHVAGLLKS